MTSPDISEERVREIARGLTKAQREAIAALSQVPRRSTMSGAALMALCRKGLAHNGWSSFNGNVWSITPLGLAVRNHLSNHGGGDRG